MAEQLYVCNTPFSKLTLSPASLLVDCICFANSSSVSYPAGKYQITEILLLVTNGFDDSVVFTTMTGTGYKTILLAPKVSTVMPELTCRISVKDILSQAASSFQKKTTHKYAVTLLYMLSMML